MARFGYLRILFAVACASAASAGTVYVDADAGDGGQTGLTWEDAYTNFAAAYVAAPGGSELWVADGTYRITSTVNLRTDATVHGGFIGAETSLGQRLVWDNPPAVLDGRSSVKLLQRNSSGICGVFSGLTLYRGSGNGGGVYLGASGAKATFEDCIFDGCIGYNGAAGQTYNYSTLTFNRCIFRNNSAAYGTLSSYNRGSIYANNCLFHGNLKMGCRWDATGWAPPYSYAYLRNCTFADHAGSSVVSSRYRNVQVHVYNCIFWNPGKTELSGAGYTVAYCDIEGGYAGTENLNVDPLFVGGGDYQLQSDSPCKDMGSNEHAPEGTDLAGNRRISGTTVDMGCYEFATPATVVILR